MRKLSGLPTYTNTFELEEAAKNNCEPLYYTFEKKSFCSTNGFLSVPKYQALVKQFDFTYIASETVFQVLGEQYGGVIEIPYGKDVQYIVKAENNVAIFARLVFRDGFGKKRMGHLADMFHHRSTVAQAMQAIRAFLNNEKYNGFALAVPFGTQSHECCLFVRYTIDLNDRRIYQAVIYDPNLGQSRDITRSMVKILGRNASITGYIDYPSNNQHGHCNGLTWSEIYNFMTIAKKIYSPTHANSS